MTYIYSQVRACIPECDGKAERERPSAISQVYRDLPPSRRRVPSQTHRQQFNGSRDVRPRDVTMAQLPQQGNLRDTGRGGRDGPGGWGGGLAWGIDAGQT